MHFENYKRPTVRDSGMHILMYVEYASVIWYISVL